MVDVNGTGESGPNASQADEAQELREKALEILKSMNKEGGASAPPASPGELSC